MTNADVNPREEFVRSHRRFRRLVENKAISAQFWPQERAAIIGKRGHTRIGLASLWTIGLTMAFLIVILSFHIEVREELVGIPIVVAVVAFLIQLRLLGGKDKKRWLRARFAAERLRCVKFQAFAVAAQAGRFHDAAVETFTANAIAELQLELDNAPGAIRDFDVDRALLVPVRPVRLMELHPKEFAQLKHIYNRMRLEYQGRHATWQIQELTEQRKFPAAASEIAFWVGIVAALFDGVIAFMKVPAVAQSIAHAAPLLLFVLSAILFVHERGRSHSVSLERYEDYKQALVRAQEALDEAANVEAFAAAVREGERAALNELRNFCREADRSTYLF